ncbi:MAG: T9SS type A sorting domain-containing protein, partial [Nitrososphaerota archaeon]|nr:T9SS type A sorting domain-containing protein [Nitrososphaerota archaeon]
AYYCDWDSTINDWGPVRDAGPAINYAPNPDWSPGATPGCFLDDTTLIVLKAGESFITSWHAATNTWDTAVSWPNRFVNSSWDGLRFGTDAGMAITRDRRKVYTSFMDSDTTRDGKYSANFNFQVCYRDTTQPTGIAGKWYTLNISFLSDSLYFAGTDSGRYEGYPSITADGKTLFFEADYGGHFTIYESHLLIDENGDTVVNAVNRALSSLPSSYKLYPAYPNPFNPTTTVTYVLPERSKIRLSVYDILGRRIRILEEGIEPAGEHQTMFDSKGLASGTYFLLLETPQGVLTSKIALVK